MITWLDQPFKATNTADGFEVLVHGFFIGEPFGLTAICVSEEGVLHEITVSTGAIALDWRFKRGKGWYSIDDDEEDKH